ncbi:MAG: hypothetical protein JWM33_1469 [Caulobacteraceae bacterium]|nr:hypothetical protein [Caulobacteraceae bacterium]
MNAPPGLTFAFAAHVQLGPIQEFGVVESVKRRFIPIVGGRFEGPNISGEVLPGGGDWQGIGEGGLTQVLARYSLKAKDGTVIGITNPGVRRGPAEVIAKLAAGEMVDPSLYYFRASPVFEVAPGPHRWLAENTFVCVGKRWPTEVELEIFQVG